MIRRLVLLSIAGALVAGVAIFVVISRRGHAPMQPGISAALAADRAARVSAIEYAVTFRVPAARTDPVTGHLRATFNLSDASRPLAFDFAQPVEQLLAMHANSTILAPRVEAEHVVIPADALREGENIVEFEFRAGEAPLNRNDEFLYALFVPARASQVIPVFDQPDLKARWQLILDVPKDWTAVSNGRETGRSRGPNHVGYVFEQTQPIPTYLFSFAAGKFSIDSDIRNGREFRMLHRETDAAKLERNRAAIYDLHAQALAWLENYTGIPYPFGKFDFVLIPSFQFGGMEHPGAVFYNASSLLLDPSATQSQYLGRASLIAHETSHMWFGDLVTMKWFNDVWMKEVFANLMAAKIVNPSFPEVNHELRFLFQHYPGAYDVDRTDGSNPIRQELANLNEAGSLYGAIIYQKAPIAMRQLELLLGADRFRDGLREYLAAHKFGNATWADLIAVLDAKTDQDLGAWSRAWIEERGRPRITTGVTSAGTTQVVELVAEDPLDRRLTWPQALVLTEGHAKGSVDTRVDFSSMLTHQREGSEPLAWILPNGAGLGYGDFVLDEANLAAVANALPSMTSALSRGAATVLLWESMLEGRLAPAMVMEVLLTALPLEKDELIISQMLDYARSLYWRYTAADDRGEIAPRLETVLADGLARASSTSQKSAWFNALRSIASTAPRVEWLEKVWRREIAIPKLALAESDEADLALDLAVRDVPNAAQILDAQLERFKNPDRKARFAFVRPALSGDAKVREAFFASLKDVTNRRREAWVLEAARYLHHPLRAPASRKLVVEALELVLEIRRTGDIFFPKRWADATLGGYQSPQTASDVRAFIAALPADYPPRLKWVLLSSADPLFRASRILHQ